MLYTARLINSRQSGSAILIAEHIEEDDDDKDITAISGSLPSGGSSDFLMIEDPVFTHPAYLLTSFASEGNPSDNFDSNDIDKHVSIEVDYDHIAGGRGRPRLPRLFTKCWVHGLYFFYGCPMQDVVFPWPTTLQNL
ncbi:hypothetical protein GGR58DRAFT_386615 [Xylaria digitata]|nr:hypothetical protein GGR58DRAFT_386615 [Xylaria digitata]